MKIKSFLIVLGITAAMTGLAHAQLTVDIHVFDFDFGTASHLHENPTIHPGDTVHWVWDSGSHSTTAAAGQAESWDSGVHTPSFGFDHTFNQIGTFDYFCSIHGFDAGGGNVGGMSGSIIVTPVLEPAGWGLMAGSLLLGYSALRRRHGQCQA